MGFDPIMQQAENLARMSAMSTPLAGGENPSLHPTDFSGATPKMQVWKWMIERTNKMNCGEM